MADAFEWNEAKRLANIEKPGIDFHDAIAVFEHPHLTLAAMHAGEARFVSLGFLDSVVIAVVWTDRAGVIRLISARKARRNEREIYHASLRS